MASGGVLVSVQQIVPLGISELPIWSWSDPLGCRVLGISAGAQQEIARIDGLHLGGGDFSRTFVSVGCLWINPCRIRMAAQSD